MFILFFVLRLLLFIGLEIRFMEFCKEQEEDFFGDLLCSSHFFLYFCSISLT